MLFGNPEVQSGIQTVGNPPEMKMPTTTPFRRYYYSRESIFPPVANNETVI